MHRLGHAARGFSGHRSVLQDVNGPEGTDFFPFMDGVGMARR